MICQTSYFLARLHEFAQLQLDRKTDFMVGEEFSRLSALERLSLRGAVADVTAALGRHTMAILCVNGHSIEQHLPELFERLNALEGVAARVGAPTCSGGFDRYATALLPQGGGVGMRGGAASRRACIR